MPIDDYINLAFSAAEQTAISDAATAIEATLLGKTVNLTPEERSIFGSINEERKQLINKSYAFTAQHPSSVPPQMDVLAYGKDKALRDYLDDLLVRVDIIREQLSDTKILADRDCYTAALDHYNYVRYLSEVNFPGMTTLYQELRDTMNFNTPAEPDAPQADGGGDDDDDDNDGNNPSPPVGNNPTPPVGNDPNQ